jgi:hypothetical protein
MNLTGLRLVSRTVVVTAFVVVMAGALSAVPPGSPEAQFIFGPEREEFYLMSAEVTSDGKVGLFSFNQIFQRRAQPEAYVSAGKYRVGARVIFGYDWTSRRITVIHRSPGTEESKFEWGRQTWGYRISGICWGRVLVEGDERVLYWLDMTSGTLTRTALREEWTAKGIDVRHYWVIDRHGTIAMWALPARREGALAMAQYLWLRTPSGKYIDVGPFHDARMLDDNRFLLKSPLVAPHASGAHNVLYSMTTGARQLTGQEGMDLVMHSLSPSHRSYWCSRADRQVLGLRQGGAGAGPLEERNPVQIELWRRNVRESITLDIEALRTALRR